MAGLLLVVCWGTIAFVAIAPASAGGSIWNVERDHYEPGEHAFVWAQVAWEHNSSLGTPADGPYSAYLLPEAVAQSRMRPEGGPLVDDDALWIAEIAVSLEPYSAGPLRFGPHHASFEFTVPDLPVGRYEILHCSADCTKTLGDVTWGILTIGPEPIPPPPPTAPETTVHAPPTPISSSGAVPSGTSLPPSVDVVPIRAQSAALRTDDPGSGFPTLAVLVFGSLAVVVLGSIAQRRREA
jgi:hypothetical protein